MVMQNIEKALFNVFQAIGNQYDFPQGEWIADVFHDGNKFRNPYFGQTAKAVKFDKGTQIELNIWLTETKDKYPLVWLVYPVGAKFNNNVQSFETYKGARLVFAVNNESDKSVDTRIHTTKVILESIVANFLDLMRNSSFRKYIYIDKNTDMTRTFYPNYSSTKNQSESGTVDIWDAITLDCDIHLIPNCIK